MQVKTLKKMNTVKSRVLTRVNNQKIGFLGVLKYEMCFKTSWGSINRSGFDINFHFAPNCCSIRVEYFLESHANFNAFMTYDARKSSTISEIIQFHCIMCYTLFSYSITLLRIKMRFNCAKSRFKFVPKSCSL